MLQKQGNRISHIAVAEIIYLLYIQRVSWVQRTHVNEWKSDCSNNGGGRDDFNLIWLNERRRRWVVVWLGVNVDRFASGLHQIDRLKYFRWKKYLLLSLFATSVRRHWQTTSWQHTTFGIANVQEKKKKKEEHHHIRVMLCNIINI